MTVAYSDVDLILLQWHDYEGVISSARYCNWYFPFCASSALTSLATAGHPSCLTSPQTEKLLLLDATVKTCVKVKSDMPPKKFTFGMVNKNNLTSVNVSTLAEKCDEPYLTVSAMGSCDSEAFAECRLIRDTPHLDLRSCRFRCHCGSECAFVLADAQSFRTKKQRVCEISVSD